MRVCVCVWEVIRKAAVYLRCSVRGSLRGFLFFNSEFLEAIMRVSGSARSAGGGLRVLRYILDSCLSGPRQPVFIPQAQREALSPWR